MNEDGLRLIFDGVVAIVAVLGLVLGLVNLAYTYRTTQPRLKVSLSVGVITTSAGLGPTYFILAARNVGPRAVTLSSAGVDLRESDDTAVFLAPPPFAPPLPFTLEPGRSWQYHIDPEAVLEYHRGPKGPVRGPFVNDETGRHWSGRSKREWLDSWARKSSPAA